MMILDASNNIQTISNFFKIPKIRKIWNSQTFDFDFDFFFGYNYW